MTAPTPAPEPTPAPSLFTPEQEAAVAGAVKKGIAEYIAENTPAPDKTVKPAGGIFDALFKS